MFVDNTTWDKLFHFSPFVTNSKFTSPILTFHSLR